MNNTIILNTTACNLVDKQ